ncbi:hypothetical protein NQ176_g4098 [Zarea fungicola]|uniref:Uncharacterized protein n=1 Tax=Zarea fungicola TaxID=93591 RepID=A0ACC1NHM8_9HYPO|nr:hypothetical protein NQ176_g4098 [Lecanicillium fungicola]
MRFNSILPLIGGLVSSVSADFHVGRSDFSQQATNPDKGTILQWSDYFACPSNYYQCKCFGQLSSDRGVKVKSGSTTGQYFSLESGLCGMGQLDFYYRPNLGHWEFYVNGGDGKVQGTCYSNSAETVRCGNPIFSNISAGYHDQLVCYSYICNP